MLPANRPAACAGEAPLIGSGFRFGTWSRFIGLTFVLAASPPVAASPWNEIADGDTCVAGPLPGNPPNPDNQLLLCSPLAGSLTAEVLPEGLALSWDAPPRSTSTYVSPVIALRWTGIDSLAVVPAITIEGTYLDFVDRRIQLDVQSIEGDSGFVDQGAFGVERIRVAWNSIYESGRQAVRGEFVVDASNADVPLRFEVPPPPGMTTPPDTTKLGGLRIRFRRNSAVARENAAAFDVEDFEGWHVWRWDANAASPVYRNIGEYSKLAATASPLVAWPGATPGMRRVHFLDRNVFDGFLYHYAVTTFDQGFRRSTNGQTYFVKFESPLAIPGPTQLRFEFRRPPPAEFRPITAVPNPFRDSASDGSRESSVVFFTSAPPRGTLYIFTLSGDLVLERSHELPSIGTITWDTRNARGEKVTSGVYIYKIVDLVSGQQSYGRLAVIR
jgi:hypothetical protein